MRDDDLLLKKEGAIAIVTININKYNVFSSHLIKDFEKMFTNLHKNKKVKVVIITGSKKAFCAGANIKEMGLFNIRGARKYATDLHKVFNTIENSETIFIAAINGYALGAGNELAISCDLRFASHNAKFGQPEVTIGIPTGGGATERLPKLIGLAKTKELIYTGRIIGSKEAEKIGLVNKIVKDPLKEAKKVAKEIIQNSPHAVSVSKKMLISNKQQIKREIKEWIKCFRHPDQREGMRAFAEKRKARWKK